MNFLQRLSALFSARPPQADTRFLSIYLFNQRCQEAIVGRVDMLNDLSIGEEGKSAFYARKIFHTSGDKRCFSQVEVQLWFDDNKRVINKEVEGGRWLEEDEYHAIQAAQAAEEEARRLAADAEENPPPAAKK